LISLQIETATTLGMSFLFSQGKSFSTSQDIRSYQEQGLNRLLTYLQQLSPFYQTLFNAKSLNFSKKIFLLEDLASLPFTDKEDLQQRNWDFLCVGKEKVVEYVTTTGTTGQPVTIALTENDLQRLAYNEYCSFLQTGISARDAVLLTVTNDRCFMAGQAYALGARKMGAATIRTGPGLPELQWDTIARLKPTLLVAVPSFIVKLIDYAERNGIDYTRSSIKKALCVGEPLRNEHFALNVLGEKIAEKWPIELYSTYASTEMATAFTECKFGRGGHLNPELLIVECVDEEGKAVPEGTIGEIVVTTLGIEAMPLLRFRTGDMAALHTSTCECGNPSLRLSPIVGRKKQMVKYKGTTLYPPSIKDVLHDHGVGDAYYMEVSQDELGMDKLVVFLPLQLAEKLKFLQDAFKARLRVVPILEFIPQQEIDKVRMNPSVRKPIDFIDKRIVNS